MLDNILRRLPNWLISVALILVAIIVMIQRFGFGQPIYAHGVILPSKEVIAAATMASDAREKIEHLSATLPDLKTRIDDLEQQQIIDLAPIDRRVGFLEKEIRGAGGIMKGAVLAFDHPDGCPAGWREFTEGQGRFILGVNGSEYKLPYVSGRPDYQTGGEEEVVLTLAEMPIHRHSVYGRYGYQRHDDARFQGLAPNDLDSENRSINNALSEEGGNEAHNNMPPYIALYFCKYEGKKNT